MYIGMESKVLWDTTYKYFFSQECKHEFITGPLTRLNQVDYISYIVVFWGKYIIYDICFFFGNKKRPKGQQEVYHICSTYLVLTLS